MAIGTASGKSITSASTISSESIECNTSISKGDKRIATSPLDTLEQSLRSYITNQKTTIRV